MIVRPPGLRFCQIVCLALLALVTVESRAATLILSGSTTSVTHIRSDDPNLNFGSDIYMIVGRTTEPAILRGLLSYSLSQIPAGSTITDITLTIRSALISGVTPVPNVSGSVALNLHALAGTFTEGGGGNQGTPFAGWASWERRGNGAWNTLGGDYLPTVLSSANVDPTLNVTGTVSEFPSTAEFVAAAQAALDSGTPLSLLLKLNDVHEAENERRAFHFHSDDASGQSSNTPTLAITYVPEPAGAGLILGGAAVLFGTRRRVHAPFR